jgi:membrane protease YdiL (CAAX protease family)
MNLFAEQSPSLGFIATAFLAFGASLVIWTALIERWTTGKSILPYQPRLQVPWQFRDLIVIVLFHYGVMILFFAIGHNFLSTENQAPVANIAKGTVIREHPLVQLLAAGDSLALVVGAIVAILLAPITEELFFRVLVQGWLEKVERNWRHHLPAIRRIMPFASMPIFCSALLFASVHFRTAGAAMESRDLFWLFIGDGIARICTLLFSILWVYWRVGATAEDLGWMPKNILPDVRLGVCTFMAIAIPIFLIQAALMLLLPEKYAPDPIAIFFFAIVLGLLYNRTHRIVPAIALHTALNATSLMIFLITSAK